MRLQALLTALTFGVALAPFVFFFLRTRRRPVGLVLAVVWLIGVGGLYQYGHQYRPDLLFLQIASRRPIEKEADGYVSSKTCQACHPNEYASWHDSYHRTMTQVATTQTLKADFDKLEFDRGPHLPAYELREQGDTIWAITNDPALRRRPEEGEVVTRPIALVTGSHHEQMLWMLGDQWRRVHLFPFAYRIREDRWAPYMSVVVAPESAPLEPDQMWNRICLRCHTTHPRVRNEGHLLDTKVGEFGIACEACHGPGKRHVEANRNPLRRYALHLSGERTPPASTTSGRRRPAASATA